MLKARGRTQKELQRKPLVLEKIQNRALVEIWILKVIVVKSELEMKNMLLEIKREDNSLNSGKDFG